MAQLQVEGQLQKIFSNVNDWLKFAEAKNFGLLTLNAGMAVGIGQANFKGGNIIELVGDYWFIPLALLSCFFSLLSLFPILTTIEKGKTAKRFLAKMSSLIDNDAPFENIHFYGYLRTIDVQEFITKFQLKTGASLPFTEYEKELVVQVLYNSRITWLKYQLFKIAGFFTFIAIVLAPFIALGIKLFK